MRNCVLASVEPWTPPAKH